MTKVIIAGSSDSREETMRLLQEVGVLHIEPSEASDSDYEKLNSDLLGKVKKLEQLLAALEQYKKRETAAEVEIPDEELVPYAEERLVSINELDSRLKSLERLQEDLSLWGDFDLKQIRALENCGVYIARFCMDGKTWQGFEPPEDLYLEVVSSEREVCFYAISSGAPPDIPQAQRLSWPENNPEEIGEEIQEISARIETISDELAGVAGQTDFIKSELTSTINEASYAGNVAALHEEPYLFGLEGWIPQDQEDSFRKSLTESGLPLRVETRPPDDEEEPPTLFRNNWFVKNIEPLLKLYGVPKYRDLDPSFYFAPFMVLFFGICLGDVGYGILFYVIAYVIGKKWGDRSDQLLAVVKLCKFFAVSSVIVGILTGSIFGISFANRSWILLDIDVKSGDPMMLLYIALGIGIVHLSVSFIMGIFESYHFHEKMTLLGTMFVLWGGVTLIVRGIWINRTSFIYTLTLYIGAGFIVAGLLLTLMFPNNSKKWGPRLGLGLWNVYGLTGLLGDVLSYARLFGLGLATTAIASVMNELAGMAYNGLGAILGGVLAGLILIVGHSFNFALALLGSTIHSARLHFVEAFKNFYQGDGVEYEPFKIERGPS